MKKIVCIIALFLFAQCGQAKQAVVEDLPEITADTETTLEIWCWNVAAKGLQLVADEFMKKYPKISINVVEFGGPAPTTERATVVYNSGTGMPDVIGVESDFVQTYAEAYPHRFLDLKPYIDPAWESQVDPSKVPVSYDTEGRLVSIPWDSGPVVMFYHKGFFDKAGVNPDNIKTWDDFIAAGKKIQAANPGVRMMGAGFTADDGLWRILMVQSQTYYLNTNGQITINSPASQRSLELIRRLRDEGVLVDTVNWTGGIQALKNGTVAVSVTGGWWGGTMKDQAPEHAGKWRIMRMPAFPGENVTASSLGGSTLMVSASDPVRKAASVEFVKFALLNADMQYAMYSKYGLFPSYIPTYDKPEFSEADPYFGGQNVNAIYAEVIPTIPPVIYNSKDYGALRNIAISAYEQAINTSDDIATIVQRTAEQMKTTTGRDIAK
ncbi:MAG: ABC transporter substrate-binding protein [Brevinema sp.]